MVFPKLVNSEFRNVLPLGDVAFSSHPLKPESGRADLIDVEWYLYQSPPDGGMRPEAAQNRCELWRWRLDGVWHAARGRLAIIEKAKSDGRLSHEGMVAKQTEALNDLFARGAYGPDGWVGSLDNVAGLVEKRATEIQGAMESLPIMEPDADTAAEWRDIFRKAAHDGSSLRLIGVALDNGIQPILAVLKGGPTLSGMTRDEFEHLRNYTRALGNLMQFSELRIEAECMDCVRIACVRVLRAALAASHLPPSDQKTFIDRLGEFKRMSELSLLVRSFDDSMWLRNTIPASLLVTGKPEKKASEAEEKPEFLA